MSTYVMSDIHGCYVEFIQMLNEIKFTNEDTLILAGDYIDRGLQSYKMIQWIKNNIHKKNIIILKGNHEEEFIEYVDILKNIDKKNELSTDYNSNDDLKFLYDSCLYYIKQKNPIGLLYFDPYKTLYDFIFDKKICLNELIVYSNIFKGLSYFYKIKNTVIVHAGYTNDFTKIKNKYKKIEDFYLYARDDNYQVGGFNDGTIIFGHTPTIFENEKCYSDGDIYEYFNKTTNCRFIDIDCGISYRDDFPNSQLACIRIEDKIVFYI